MFRIGDFSRIARVSCRLLRYYDELGLLQPGRVEQHTGYRYYSAAQLPRLNRILVLKELGMSLEQIARIIDANPSAAELRAMLLVRRNDAERAVQAEAARLRQIETRIAQVDADGALSVDDVVVRAEPARTLLSLRRTVASFAEARGLIGELHAAVKGRPPGALMAIAHAQAFEQDEIDVEFGFVLEGSKPKESVGPLQLRELPNEESVAACVRIGLPEHAHLVTGKIGSFVEANGYELAGPSRELFLQPPQPDRMEEAVVEMQFPIKKKPA
jgi:DNA-binding transcriptional MerR regulator